MDYEHINTFLEKFRKIFKDNKKLKEIILDCINKNLNFQIKEDEISIKPPFIKIKGSPIVRNEILIKKEKILNEIKQNTKDIIIQDIR